MNRVISNRRLLLVASLAFAALALTTGFRILVLNTVAGCSEKYARQSQTTGAQSMPAISIAEVESPAPQGSFLPNLVTAPDGTALLSWIELAKAETHKIRFAIRQGNVWTPPTTIYAYKRNEFHFTEPSTAAMLALADGTLVAQWVGKIKLSNGPYARNIYVSFSRDRGKSWSKPITPHRDGKVTDHSFVSMAPAGRNSVALFWLDARKMKYTPPDDYEGPSMVMHTIADSNGKLGPEIEIDEDVCSCCPTTAALTARGLIVAYRDHTDEIRDISFARFLDNSWSKPQTLHPDNWEINGCPVSGPVISTQENRLAVTWHTAAKEVPQVKVCFSEDAGERFGDPVKVDEGKPVGRPDVALTEKGGALVSWVEKTEAGLQILARHVYSDGRRSRAFPVWASVGGGRVGFPHLTRNGDHSLAAWTDPAGNKKVRVAAIRMTDE